MTRVGCARSDLLAATAFLFPSFTSIWPTAVRLGPLMAVAWLVLVVSLLCPMGWAQQDVIVDVRVSGNRRIPADTIKARIFTKPGDIYDAAALERDFNSLWNTGYFEDIRFEREQTPKGWIIHVYVK